MTRLARLSFAAGVLLFALACHNDSFTPPTGGPLVAFSDGAHEGNPDFFFLPPLFKNPSSDPDFEPAAFNANVKPVVEICELDAAFTCVDGPPLLRFETAELRLTDQHYQVNWRTDESNLTLTSYYRITVIVGTETLGFADVDPVGTGRELRSVETGEYIGLLDGRTLPIRFRIENGALCAGGGPCTSRTIALNAPGGNVIVLEGTGDQVTIPQQASGQVVTVTLQLCNDGEGNLTSIVVDLRRLGNCVRVTTDPNLEEALSPKARVDICSLIGEVPDLPGEQEHLITLHRQDGEVIRALPHAYGDVCSGLSSAPVPGLRGLAAAGWRWVRRNVAALVTPRPLHARAMLLDVGELGGLTDGFSDFQLALPAMMEALGGEGQACDVETPPDDRPGVCVTDAHGDPVDGATVHFEVFEGDGEVTPVEVVSGAGGVPGVAQVDEWTFEATTNRLRAFGVGIAAQNNYPEGTVRPFMPDIDDDGEPLTAEQREAQVPVLLQTGEVVFTVTEAPPVDGIIAFHSLRDDDMEIYRMNLDGTSQTRLTNNVGSDFGPDVSPDGAKIAFHRDVGDASEIHVMNADGTGLTRLTTNEIHDAGPVWSPDGTKLAFRTLRDGNFEIYVMNADGSSPTRLTSNAASDFDIDWSPDGNKIAFSSDRSESFQVHVMNADGSGVLQLTSGNSSTGPQWSPDGTKIAFTSFRAENSDIYVMNADGTGEVRLTTELAFDGEASWCPDGRIVFTTTRVGGFQIYIMNADGTGLTQLTTTDTNRHPSCGG